MSIKLFSTFAAASAVLLTVVAAASAQSLQYSNAVVSLNAAGYWPMHETTAPAQGDIETNYGSLGVLANGYYPDYQVNSGAFVRQQAGPLANGADESVYFTQPVSNAGAVTNSLLVPHTSPLATIRLPFSIELWYIITNLPTPSFEGDFLAQCDAFRLSGFRIYFQNAGTGTNNATLTGADILFYNHTTANQAFQINFGAAVTNVWHHMVATVDVNSNVSTYLDGVLQSAAGADPRQIPAGRFDPDIHEPLTIGNGLGNQRGFNGRIAEVAIYTNALAAGDIATHYSDGTNASVSASQYYNDVTSDNPTIYLRMNSSSYAAPNLNTWPVMVNYGQINGVTPGNGVYTPGTIPGVVPGTAYGGFPLGLIGSDVAMLSGVSSFADAGYANAYNPTGTMPFTVSALFRGNPTDTNRVQSIVGHGTNSWELGLSLNGSIVFNSGTNSSAAVATGTGAGDLVSTTNAYNDGNWHWVVAVHNGTTNMLYVDNIANNKNIVGANNTGNSLDVMIGSDPCYTNNPIGWGRQFAGQINEVTIFTNALTAAQVGALYNAIGIPLFNLSQPQLSKTGGSDSFTVTVSGSSPTFQWYLNTAPSYSGATGLSNGGGVSGATTATVTIANPQDYYFVVASNNYSSVTSAIVQVPQFLTALAAGEPIWNQSGQTNLIVTFSDLLDPTTATTVGNYSLNNGANVVAAVLGGSNEVVLTTSALNPGTSYTLTVQNVLNDFGVEQTPASTNLTVGSYPANLALWVRADTGVTTNADGTVNQWNDLSGNNNNLSESFYYPAAPLLTVNALGDAVVRFSGTNDTALAANSTASLAIVGDMSVVAVVNYATLAGGTNGEIVSKTGSTHANVPAPYDYYVSGAPAAIAYRGDGNTGTGNLGLFTATKGPSLGTPHIVAFSETGNTVSHYLDGQPVGSGVLSGGFQETNCADLGQDVIVGGRLDNVNRLTGDISELIVAGSPISSYDISALDSYLATRHNLVLFNVNPTNVVAAFSNNLLTLSWPADHTGWELQSNSVGLTATGAWYNVSGSTTTNQITITPDTTKTNVFYRMYYQP